MKLIIIKSHLKEGLDIVSRIVGEGQNLPILKNILITVKENIITLTTTNLELAIQCKISGKTIEEGGVVVLFNTLSQIINTIPAERLNLETKQQNLEIKSENYNALLHGFPVDEFPIIPNLKQTKQSIQIKGDVLKKAFSQVLPSAHTSDIHPELNSVLFTYSLDELKIVATDSVRLSEKIIPKSQFSSSHEEKFKILIPLKTTQEIIRIIKDDEVVVLCHDETQLSIKNDRFEFISRLLEGTFPEYSHIVPTTFGAEVIVGREELINAVKLCGVFGGKISEVKIKTTENKKTIEVSSRDQTAGENSYLLPAKITGSSKEVSFNWHYLLDGLKAISSNEVYVGINEENKPALLKSPTETLYFYVLMPLITT